MCWFVLNLCRAKWWIVMNCFYSEFLFVWGIRHNRSVWIKFSDSCNFVSLLISILMINDMRKLVVINISKLWLFVKSLLPQGTWLYGEYHPKVTSSVWRGRLRHRPLMSVVTLVHLFYYIVSLRPVRGKFIQGQWNVLTRARIRRLSKNTIF